MNEKKVILFIVEGPSDRAALGPIMEEYFNSEDIKFLIVHGDITIKNYITKDNAIIKVNEQIKEKLKELKKKYNYSKTDYIKIIQYHQRTQKTQGNSTFLGSFLFVKI